MPDPTIKIIDDMPENDVVNVTRNGKIIFKSGDNKKYYIDFHSDDRGNITGDKLPLEIPANGSAATLNISANAVKKTFIYKILDAKKNQVWPEVTTGVGDVPPQVIVKD